MKKFNVMLCMFVLHVTSCYSQNMAERIDLSRVADELIGFQDGASDDPNAFDNLIQVMSHPLNLNLASSDDLRALHLLSESQINALANYKQTNGAMISIYELQAVPEFDMETIRKLSAFVNVIDPHARLNQSILNRMFLEENSYLVTRYERTIEQKNGYRRQEDPQRKFTGSADEWYLRFKTSKPGDFSFGFTLEKDAGEEIQWQPSKKQYGFDFISYHAQVQAKGRLKNLIIGDFQTQFGQGLVLGGAFGLGKGAETVTTARRTNAGLLPYASVNESAFYRGIGATYALNKNILVTTFGSSISRDGTLQDEETNGTSISALQFTGLHRNEAERANRKILKETNYGTVINYTSPQLDAGVIFNRVGFSKPVIKNPNVYNQFSFRGTSQNNMSAFLNYNFLNLTFFSEWAMSLSAGNSIIAGLIGSLHKNFDVTLVHRKFDRNFFSFYANAFAESTQPQNESGFYWGWKYYWSRKYTVAGYVDLFRFPWLGFRRYAPSSGHEWLLKFNYQPSKKWSAFVQVREENKARNLSQENNLYTLGPATKRNYWLVLNCVVNERLKMNFRIQYSTFVHNNEPSDGMVLLHSVVYSLGRLQLSARHAVFDTDNFDNRQYVYENDVFMAFSLPAYEGIGVRNYVLLEYKVSKKMSIWARYARTRYTDRSEIGSGLEMIDGNIRKDIKFQAIIRF
jgi:hypothetical protein